MNPIMYGQTTVLETEHPKNRNGIRKMTAYLDTTEYSVSSVVAVSLLAPQNPSHLVDTTVESCVF